jgi:hypothetical protein
MKKIEYTIPIPIPISISKMGSFISSAAMYTNKNTDKKCFTCSKKITEKTYIKCVRCDIFLHKQCEELTSNKYYTICPRCDRCGSLGSIDEGL